MIPVAESAIYHYEAAARWLERAEVHLSTAGDVDAAHFANAAALVAQVHVALGDRAASGEAGRG